MESALPDPWSPSPGDSVVIFTTTWILSGRVLGVSPQAITLDRAAFVRDSGLQGPFMSGSEPDENEPLPDEVQVSVARGSVVAILPRALCRTRRTR